MAKKTDERINDGIRTFKRQGNLALRIVLLGVLFLLLLFALIFALSSRQNRLANESALSNPAATPFINPSDPEAGRNQTLFLYFRQQNTDMLVAQKRQITVNTEETPEEAAVRELIRGPGNDASELLRLIPATAEIVRAEGKGDIFYITFNRNILLLEGSEQGPDSSISLTRRRLMYYSIVNTITNVGHYAQVQVLIDDDSTGYGSQPAVSDFGLLIGNETGLLAPSSYEETVVLNAKNTAESILRTIRDGNWQEVYARNLSTMGETETIPDLAEMQERLQDQSYVLVDWKREGQSEETVEDEELFRYELIYTLPDGQYQRRLHIPVSMVWESGRWKMPVSVFLRIVEWPDMA